MKYIYQNFNPNSKIDKIDIILEKNQVSIKN